MFAFDDEDAGNYASHASAANPLAFNNGYDVDPSDSD